MSRVQLKKIDKRYGEKTAVSGLDLECENGEFVVLFGRPVLAQKHDAQDDRRR